MGLVLAFLDRGTFHVPGPTVAPSDEVLFQGLLYSIVKSHLAFSFMQFLIGVFCTKSEVLGSIHSNLRSQKGRL